MTNFNPQEQNSLMALLQGLQGGMQPTQGYGFLQDILAQQSARQQQRQQNLQGLTSLLTNAAGSGATYDQAQMLMAAQSGGNIAPRIQQDLNTFYPQQGGTSMDIGGPTIQNNATLQSPVYQPPQPSISDMNTMQNAATQQADQQGFAVFAGDLQRFKAQGTSLDAALQTILATPHGQALLASDPSTFKAIASMVYGSIAVSTQGGVPVG